jgi:hypothetical protein
MKQSLSGLVRFLGTRYFALLCSVGLFVAAVVFYSHHRLVLAGVSIYFCVLVFFLVWFRGACLMNARPDDDDDAG